MKELIKTKKRNITLRFATEEDTLLIFNFIKDLAQYEKLFNEVEATEELLRETLFGERKYVEILIAEFKGAPAGFAIFYHNFSTFLGKPGIYVEDLFVKPEFRKNGIGKTLLSYITKLGAERNCGRIEWAVLDWNEPAIQFYRSLGSIPKDEWTIYRLSGSALIDLAKEF
jgi:GNAT superfamily N-acetyltransferase